MILKETWYVAENSNFLVAVWNWGNEWKKWYVCVCVCVEARSRDTYSDSQRELKVKGAGRG